MKVRAKHVCEYAALRLAGGLVCLLPRRLALAVGWCLARLAYTVMRSRVAEAKRRIRCVFGESMADKDVVRIAWRSLRNMAFNAVEMLRVGRESRESLVEITDCEQALTAFRRQMEKQQGAVIALPHMGNWELAATTCFLSGIPLFSIGGTQRNPLTNDYILRLRQRTGMISLDRGAGTMRGVLTRLRRGEMLGILPDVRVREAGVTTPFLGGKANLGKGMAMFARHAGVPILPCVVTRVGGSRHRIEVLDPVTPDRAMDKDADIRRMTLQVMALLECAIRLDPEQWFWYNKRWVLEPLAASDLGGEGGG